MEMVGIMHSSAQNAYKLLENLLEWSRSQTGGIEYNPKDFVLRDLVVETKKLCENLAREKNISIHYDISDNLIGLCGSEYVKYHSEKLADQCYKVLPIKVEILSYQQYCRMLKL